MTAGAGVDWRRTLQQAVERHQGGKIGEAITLYQAVLAQQPDNADALHLIGMAFEQTGHPDAGLPFVEQAIRAMPAAAAFHNSLGNIRKALGDTTAARDAYGQAVRLDPAFAEAHNNLGLLALSAEDWPAAAGHFRDALRADPQFLAARFNLATTDWRAGQRGHALSELRSVLAVAPVYAAQILPLAKYSLAKQDLEGTQALAELLEQGRIPPVDRHLLRGGIAAMRGDDPAAEAAYRAVLALDPDHGECLGLLGKLLLEREAFSEALPLLERLHALQPDNLAAISALGFALSRLGAFDRAIPFLLRMVGQQPEEPAPWADLARAHGRLNRFDEACDAYRRAIALDPDRAELYANLSALEIARGNLDVAEALCHQALQRDPQSQAARGNLANILGLRKQFGQAEKMYDALLAEYPEDANSHNNLGIMMLRQERYAEGWPHFAWRWKSSGWTSPDRSRGLPRWDGQLPPQGRLLLWREQGVGDEILYSTMLPDLLAAGADVVLATDPRLVPLFGRSFPALTVVADNGSLDARALGLTCQRPFGDLGSIMRPDRESFVHQPVAHLEADPVLRDRLRARYLSDRPAGTLLVGTAWNSRNPSTGNSKSIGLRDLAGLLDRPGLQAVSLQYGKVGDDIVRLQSESGIAVLQDPEIDPMTSIDAQAAQIAALDLVVTISTAAAHLAAALGKPTLILLPDERGILWYWGHSGDRTPWYRSVRLCRREPGEPVAAMLGRARPVLDEIVAQVGQKAHPGD